MVKQLSMPSAKDTVPDKETAIDWATNPLTKGFFCATYYTFILTHTLMWTMLLSVSLKL